MTASPTASFAAALRAGPRLTAQAGRRAVALPADNVAVWDGWRGLAILCVLCGHFMGTVSIKEDRLGVDLFFALSGMLVARLLFERRVDLPTFYVRRLSRVFPALLVFVSLVYAGAALAGWSFGALEVLTNLTFLRTYVPADPHIWSGPVPVKNLWSLNVEEHAYVIMSLMALVAFAARRAGALLFALGVGAILVSLHYDATQVYEETYFLLRTECAISFVALSAAYRLTPRLRERRVGAWSPVIALSLAAVCYLEALPLWCSYVFPPLLLAFATNHVRESALPVRRLLGWRPLRLLGLWSFSVYLWQQPVYEYKWALPGPDFGLPLAAALLLGFASYALVELPFRRSINRRWAERTGAAEAGPVAGARHGR